MLGIVDYGAGNLRSVQKALEAIGERALVSGEPAELDGCDKLILPGVGSFGAGMAELSARGLDSYIRARAADTKILGICLGMQFLLEKSFEEGEFAGLGLIPGQVVRFTEGKIPQIGCNEVHGLKTPLFEGIAELLASAGIAIDAGIVIAAVAILLGARFLHGNNMSFFRLTILALLSVALYLSAALAANWGVVNLVIMTVARMLIFAYVWALFSTPARTMSPMRLFSVGWLLFLVPNMLITRLGLVVSGGQGSSAAFELALAVALLLLFVFEFTPLLTDRYANEDGAESPGAVAEPKDAFAARIAALVDHGGLTPREQDVLVALARGRSAQYIADTFVVSKETARTHIRHIYQKLAVHSREELMDLGEEGMPRPDQRTAVNSPVSESIT